ncbi:terpene cyclase/mutase family protein [Verrucomicrobiaceae bacterium R5-34]|uniref:Terpene cyclase/mutase family protein n=1 Tax=Oceaniferula flava TaxID=2800421 RepID=A0AAE2SBN9_9BACT|nr:terpene cyclase/mutase family protein [Oceaniferula flavus]MBK1831961.1 terpene cyclase/mutase family protein [Verrucomicrobiaceae bacterium R5-34]MBK1855271.1 terpene cyclase/mutase family protein [Oceaniferula flavus]MBM1136577.1 terpene cyclase/mutase family protein [Oceaniferula flavus]
MLRTLVILGLFVVSASAQDDQVAAKPNIQAAIKRGVDYLVSHQNKNGSWGSAHRTKGLNIYAPLPDAHQSYHAASSALALHGLLECGDQRPATIAAIEKGEKWLLSVLPSQRSINRSATYNIWGHSYGLRALASLYRRYPDPAKRAEYVRHAKIQIAKLQAYEDVNKGWGYYDFDDKTYKPSGKIMSFTTATAVLALHDASTTMGIELPPVLMKRSLESLQEMRTTDFSYVYGRGHRFRPRSAINRPAGSLGRSQACNAASRVLGDEAVTDEVLRTWIDRLFERNGWLDIGRKRPIPHEAPAQVAGYFYFYAHYYAAECIEMLPENEQAQWKEKLAALMITKQEKNGSWWDFPLYNYHYAYGTGYVLTILGRCQ